MSLQTALQPNTGATLRTGPGSSRSKVHEPCKSIEALGCNVTYGRDVEIYGEKEPAEYFYKVVSGAVRTYKMLVDGRRQICTFHLDGEFFGLEFDETRRFSAEAVVDSKIVTIKRRSVMLLAQHDKRVADQLWKIIVNELRLSQAHGLLLIQSATERVAGFLLEMAERMSFLDRVDLPMSRRDIADHLGLTIETISRSLAELEDKAAISMPSSRRIVLRDRDALCRHCD